MRGAVCGKEEMSWTQGPALPRGRALTGHVKCSVLFRWRERHARFRTFVRHNLELACINTLVFPYFVMMLHLGACPVCQVTRVSHGPLSVSCPSPFASCPRFPQGTSFIQRALDHHFLTSPDSSPGALPPGASMEEKHPQPPSQPWPASWRGPTMMST